MIEADDARAGVNSRSLKLETKAVRSSCFAWGFWIFLQSENQEFEWLMGPRIMRTVCSFVVVFWHCGGRCLVAHVCGSRSRVPQRLKAFSLTLLISLCMLSGMSSYSTCIKPAPLHLNGSVALQAAPALPISGPTL